MNNIKVKRIIAFCIDSIIVSIICSLLSEIHFLNPKYEKYQDSLDKYVEYYENNLSDIENLSINDIKNSKYTEIYYEISRYGVSYTIIQIIVTILYFTLFAYYNDGMTIGKRLLKIKVISTTEKKATIIQLFLRSLLIPVFSIILINNNIGNILLVILVLTVNSANYLQLSNIISNVINVFGYANVLLMFSTKNSLSLHDKIVKTKVIEK